MKVKTIDSIEHEHPDCTPKESGPWLHIEKAGRWVASYLRCGVVGFNPGSKRSTEDVRQMFNDLFGKANPF